MFQTVMAVIAYYVVPDEQWLSRRSIALVLAVTEGKEVPVDEKKE